MKPSKRKITVLKQICKLIPRNVVSKLAKKHGVDKQSRSFSPWSHVISLVYAQLSHAMSLNDVCDALSNHASSLKDIRGATPPSRNGLSYANRKRNADMAEDLFWNVLGNFHNQNPKFGLKHKYCKLPRRFKRTINAVDSSTIQLFANCLDWAKHRRRKAAAKMHLRLDLQSFLPQVVIVKSANSHDSVEAKELCCGVRSGEIVVFDKAYVDFNHLNILSRRQVFWVTRAKDNMQYKVVRQHSVPRGNIIRDIEIKLTVEKSAELYSDALRLVEAEVEVNGQKKVMIFITNNFEWAASSICELYKARWGIELFFKQIKQTLQISDFLGYNENAVRWQIWTALLAYLILRYIGYMNKWKYSFPRLFTVLRAVLWSLVDLNGTLKLCGTAHGPIRLRAAPEQGYLPSFCPC